MYKLQTEVKVIKTINNCNLFRKYLFRKYLFRADSGREADEKYTWRFEGPIQLNRIFYT